MENIRFYTVLTTLFTLLLVNFYSADALAKTTHKRRKKVIYRTHTEVDLSGSAVQGKARAPEVFYIFQRKRTEDHDVIKTPVNLDHLRNPTLSRLKELVK